jgi:hypothetical protein
LPAAGRTSGGERLEHLTKLAEAFAQCDVVMLVTEQHAPARPSIDGRRARDLVSSVAQTRRSSAVDRSREWMRHVGSLQSVALFDINE